MVCCRFVAPQPALGAAIRLLVPEGLVHSAAGTIRVISATGRLTPPVDGGPAFPAAMP
jgi:hypothetical protein